MALVVDLADAARRAHHQALGVDPAPWEALDPLARLAWVEAAVAVWARLIFADHGLDIPPAE